MTNTVPATDLHRPRRALVGLLTTIAIVLTTYLPQLGAPLELQDDHRIIAPVITPHPGGVTGAVRMWSSAILTDVHEVGRFRPVNQVFDVIGPLVLGPSGLVWHIWLILLAAIVAALLYLAALRLWHSVWAASVFALVVLLAPDPGPTSAWYRPGPKEAWGLILLAAALLTMVSGAGRGERRSDFISFGLAVLAAFSKESFILLLPALFGVRLWLEVRAGQITISEGLRRLRVTAAAYGLMFLSGSFAILFVVRSAGSRSYGGQSLTMSPWGVARALARDLIRAPSLSIWFVPVLLAFWVAWRRREYSRPDLLAVLVFLAWIGPQLALYATRGGMWDYYWIPCIVAFAAVNAASLAKLGREERPFFYRLAVCVFTLWLVNAVRIDMSAVVNFKTKARVQQEAVRIAADHLTAQSMLVIIADGNVESERAPAFADFVSARGGQFRRVLLYDTRCTEPHCSLHDLRSGEILESVDASQVSVVVHLDGTKPRPSAAVDWYRGDFFQQQNAAGEYWFLSLRNRGLVTIPFSIRVDVRKQTAAANEASEEHERHRDLGRRAGS